MVAKYGLKKHAEKKILKLQKPGGSAKILHTESNSREKMLPHGSPTWCPQVPWHPWTPFLVSTKCFEPPPQGFWLAGDLMACEVLSPPPPHPGLLIDWRSDGLWSFFWSCFSSSCHHSLRIFSVWPKISCMEGIQKSFRVLWCNTIAA